MIAAAFDDLMYLLLQQHLVVRLYKNLLCKISH